LFSASFYSLRLNDRLLLVLFWFRLTLSLSFAFGFLVFDSSFVHLVPVFVLTSVFVSILISIFIMVSIGFGF